MSARRRTETSPLLAQRLSLLLKAVATVDESDAFEAVVCTRQAIGAIQGGQATGQPRTRSTFGCCPASDPRRDADQVLRPVGFARECRAASDEATTGLGRACTRDRTRQCWPTSPPVWRVRPFVAFFGPLDDFVSSKDYESQIYTMVEADLFSRSAAARRREVGLRGVPPLRDLMRTVIEFRALLSTPT